MIDFIGPILFSPAAGAGAAGAGAGSAGAGLIAAGATAAGVSAVAGATPFVSADSPDFGFPLASFFFLKAVESSLPPDTRWRPIGEIMSYTIGPRSILPSSPSDIMRLMALFLASWILCSRLSVGSRTPSSALWAPPVESYASTVPADSEILGFTGPILLSPTAGPGAGSAGAGSSAAGVSAVAGATPFVSADSPGFGFPLASFFFLKAVESSLPPDTRWWPIGETISYMIGPRRILPSSPSDFMRSMALFLASWIFCSRLSVGFVLFMVASVSSGRIVLMRVVFLAWCKKGKALASRIPRGPGKARSRNAKARACGTRTRPACRLDLSNFPGWGDRRFAAVQIYNAGV